MPRRVDAPGIQGNSCSRLWAEAPACGVIGYPGRRPRSLLFQVYPNLLCVDNGCYRPRPPTMSWCLNGRRSARRLRVEFCAPPLIWWASRCQSRDTLSGGAPFVMVQQGCSCRGPESAGREPGPICYPGCRGLPNCDYHRCAVDAGYPVRGLGLLRVGIFPLRGKVAEGVSGILPTKWATAQKRRFDWLARGPKILTCPSVTRPLR